MKKTVKHTIRKATGSVRLNGDWNVAAWRRAEIARISDYAPASSDHHPEVEIKTLHNETGIFLAFKVKDKFVRAVARKNQDMVCMDSCVEFFVQPKPDAGYLNFEMNCGGIALVYYIEDCTRAPGGFRQFKKVPAAMFKQLKIYHSLPRRVPNEIKKATTWKAGLFIPFAFLEQFVGELGDVSGQVWRGNFYKCGDKTSKPHWGYWAPIGMELNFHQPDKFAAIRFE